MSEKICVEYIWLGANYILRSKTRVMNNHAGIAFDIDNWLPQWNYDGSSTEQATGENSEVIIVPRALFKDSIRGGNNILAFCDTYDNKGNPLIDNNRKIANDIFNEKINEKPMFGLEIEYFMTKNGIPLGYEKFEKQGQYYCSVGAENTFGRNIIEEHLQACIKANISITGTNLEVAPGQAEFQICDYGISAGDHVWVAKYLLILIAEKYGVSIDFNVKPMKNMNGSGMHCNFSTQNMREGTDNKTGLEYIYEAVKLLELKHTEHMMVYGNDNEQRMTGLHETANYNTFTYGIASRNTSVRIGTDVVKNQKGYFEDRRAGSTADPYLVTSKLFETCVLQK
jgi:glutamine synthetase